MKFSKALRHIDIADVKKKHHEKVVAKKLESERIEEEKEEIMAEFHKSKSDWRNELKEQPAFKAVPVDTGKMTSSQSFAVFTNFGAGEDTGLRFSIDGGLGLDNSGGPNIFQYPTEAGGTVPAIDFSTPEGSGTAQISLGDFPLSGYAMPLGGEMYRSINQKKSEEINKELDSSEKYTKQIEADALMKARVDSNIMTGNNLQDITTSFENVKVPFDQGKFSSYMRTNIEQFQTLGAYESEIEVLENKIRKISYRHPIQITNRVATGDTEEARNKNYAKMEEFEKQIKQIKEKQRKIPADPKYPKTKISQAQFDALLKEISPADYIEGEEILKNNFLGQLEKQKKELNKKIDSLMKKYPQFNGDPERILGKWNGSVQIPIFDSDNNEIKPIGAEIGKQLEMIRLKKNIFNRMIYDSFDPSSVTYIMPPTVSDTSEPSPTEPTTEPTINKVSQKMDTQGDTLSSDEMNALLSRGFKKDAINDVLSQGGIDSLRDILSGNIEAGAFSGDSKKPLDIKKLRSTLYLRYMTGNKKPFTEKNLSSSQLKSLYKQVVQNLTTKSLATTNLVNDLGPATEDITGTLNKRQRFALGLGKNDFVYSVSSYTEKAMKDNDLRYLLGNYIVVVNRKNGVNRIKEVRDDFDFKYGYEVDRSDGSFAGDSYTKRKKGGQRVDIGRGIVGGFPVEPTASDDPFIVKAGRTGVNIGAGLGIGSPVPIKIKFVKESVNESNTFSKIKRIRNK